MCLSVHMEGVKNKRLCVCKPVQVSVSIKMFFPSTNRQSS